MAAAAPGRRRDPRGGGNYARWRRVERNDESSVLPVGPPVGRLVGRSASGQPRDSTSALIEFSTRPPLFCRPRRHRALVDFGRRRAVVDDDDDGDERVNDHRRHRRTTHVYCSWYASCNRSVGRRCTGRPATLDSPHLTTVILMTIVVVVVRGSRRTRLAVSHHPSRACALLWPTNIKILCKSAGGGTIAALERLVGGQRQRRRRES